MLFTRIVRTAKRSLLGSMVLITLLAATSQNTPAAMPDGTDAPTAQHSEAPAPALPDRPPSAETESPESTEERIRALEAKVVGLQREYGSQIQKMQETIQRLTGQISKVQNAPLPETGSTPAPIDPADMDIGEELIFGLDDSGATPPALTTSPSAVSQTPPTNGLGRIGGRSLLNNMTQPFSTTNGGLGQTLNPDIMVTGDFLGNYANRSSIPGRNRFTLREAEFGFSAAIDPYTKGTFVFAKPEDEGLEIEEGYITLLSLPMGIQARLGKMRSPFGKLNTIHTHDLPQVDRPNVYNHFFGEEGLVESGVAFSKLLPTPWFSSLDVHVANGDSLPLFGKGRLSNPLVISHLKNFFELSETQTLEVGFSGAHGPTLDGPGTRLSNAIGVDLTYRWLPANQYHALIWQTEVMTARNQTPGNQDGRLWGGYSYLEYKLNNRWSAGVRVDATQVPQLADATEYAIAPYVDLWQSEFARWRLQYKHTFASRELQSSDQAWLQYSVILGMHPPHTF